MTTGRAERLLHGPARGSGLLENLALSSGVPILPSRQTEVCSRSVLIPSVFRKLNKQIREEPSDLKVHHPFPQEVLH